MIIYLPEDVVEVLRLKVEAGRCLKCDEPQPCVLDCPEQRDVATAVQIIAGAVATGRAEGGNRLVHLPHDVADSLRMKLEAGECLVCAGPYSQSCPQGLEVCQAMRVVAKAVVAGAPTAWDKLEPDAERDWVMG